MKTKCISFKFRYLYNGTHEWQLGEQNKNTKKKKTSGAHPMHNYINVTLKPLRQYRSKNSVRKKAMYNYNHSILKNTQFVPFSLFQHPSTINLNKNRET